MRARTEQQGLTPTRADDSSSELTPDSHGPHRQRKDVLNRLARIEGHVRAVRRMAEVERACTDLLVQLAAVKAAVEQVSRIVLRDHVESCLRGAARTGAADEEWQNLKEALDRFIS